MTVFWCEEMSDVVPGTLLADDPQEIEADLGDARFPPEWAGRAVLVRRAEMLPIECIVRGYLAGQAHEEYEKSGTVHGTAMPAGLKLADRLAEPIFTPSTKADEGHDLNIDFAQAVNLVGEETATAARDICLELYARAAARAADVGFILADTKFELGYVDGVLSSVRRGVHPRLLAPVAGRPGHPRAHPAGLRQAAPARLAGRPALGPHAPSAAAPGERARGPLGALRGRLRAGHRALAGRLVRCEIMRFFARVEVQLRPGIADPEGATIERALPALGFDGVDHVRAGRSFSFEVDAADEGAARTKATELADRLLANPVIEESRLELELLGG